MTTSSSTTMDEASVVEEITPEQFKREKEAIEDAKKRALEEKEKAKKEEEQRKQQTIKYEEMDVKDVENSNDYATISKIFKAKGNQHYLKKDYISAILYYTEALEHCSKECQFKTEAEEEGEDKFYDYIKDSEDEEEDSENEDLEEKPKEEKGKACTENDKLNVNQEGNYEITIFYKKTSV